MSVNSTNSIFDDFMCTNAGDARFVSLFFTTLKILLNLPLCIFVLYLGQQRWRQQSSKTTTSHSDIFTYHMVVSEMIGLFGSILYCSGIYTHHPQMIVAGSCLYSITIPDQLSYHCLTCADRYLAVVHPITYMGLKSRGGVKIRNVSIVCIWLLCFGWLFLMYQYFPELPYIQFFCISAFAVSVVSFCSLSVLRTLTRAGPGDGNRVDISKKRAFYTIFAILGVLLLWFLGLLVGFALINSEMVSKSDQCLVITCAFALSLPSSLVQPLLFLHRAGRLPCCSYNAE